MPQGIDWIKLWSELVGIQTTVRERGDKVTDRHANPNRRWAKPDSTVDFVIDTVRAVPNATVLDIGAGKGSWVIRLSPHTRHITALDSSPIMIEAMKEVLSAEGVQNVDIVQASWPDAEVAPHDFALCSHAMYASRNLPAFIRRMEQVTRRTCFLMLRAPVPDGVMAQAAMRIWGHPYDSANFQVCYNAMLQMGIFANVLIADSGLWSPWKSPSLETALADLKRRLGVTGAEHDEFLLGLLRRRLVPEQGQFVWPRDTRSVLVYWNPNG